MPKLLSIGHIKSSLPCVPSVLCDYAAPVVSMVFSYAVMAELMAVTSAATNCTLAIEAMFALSASRTFLIFA